MINENKLKALFRDYLLLKEKKKGREIHSVKKKREDPETACSRKQS